MEEEIKTYRCNARRKNVCDNLIKTLLNIKGKTKDGVISHMDLIEMNIQEEFAP